LPHHHHHGTTTVDPAYLGVMADVPRQNRRGKPRPFTAGQQSRRIGNLSLLMPPPRPPASPLVRCLEQLQSEWQQEGHLAALWQAWPRIAGSQLAAHCRPLQYQAGLLTVGAAPGPWLQALLYNRHQLLGALRGAGFAVRDLRLQQHHPGGMASPGGSSEAEVWARHPSRIDVHGLADCPTCGRPAPAGEMARWGHCSFCRRAVLE
jgi:predicted nucleic acid-binding Zn ribbon protein